MDLFTRLYNIAKAYTNSKLNELQEKTQSKTAYKKQFKTYNVSDNPPVNRSRSKKIDPVLAEYYANLEIPYGSDINIVKAAWKNLLKKYHPDIHSAEPEKRQLATTLTQKLNEAFKAIEKAINEKKI